jgi:hypothetical protein
MLAPPPHLPRTAQLLVCSVAALLVAVPVTLLLFRF